MFYFCEYCEVLECKHFLQSKYPDYVEKLQFNKFILKAVKICDILILFICMFKGTHTSKKIR